MTKQLRARVEALKVMIHELQTMHNTAVDWRMEQDRRLNQLEATQYAHVDTSRLSETVRERIRQELSWPAAWQPLKIATETTYGTAPIRSAPESPLVERVADAIAAQATSAGIVNDRPARAAILEVAAWLRDDAPQSCPLTARWLEQEANQ